LGIADTLKGSDFGWEVVVYDIPHTDKKKQYWPFKRVVFRLKSPTQLNELYDIEAGLEAIGIQFDKGLDINMVRTWYLNRSFKVLKQEA